MPSGLSRRQLWLELPRSGRREVSAVLVASGVSTAGNSIHIVAAALLALELSKTPASVPLIALVGTIPPLLLIALVRIVAARYGGRRVLIAIDFLQFALAATLPILALMGFLEVWQVFAQELLMACCSAFYAPASRSWSSEVGDSEDKLTLVNTLLSSVMQVSSMIGWGIGGALASLFSPLGAIAINAVTFLISALVQTWGFWGRIRSPGTIPLADLTTGPVVRMKLLPLVRTVFDRSRAGALARSLVVILMAQRLQFSLFVVFLTVAVQVGEAIVGVANAAYSIGAALGAALAAGGVVGLWIRRHPTAGVIGMFAALAIFTFSTSAAGAIVVYGVVGLLSTSVVILQSLLQDARRNAASDTFAALGAVQALMNMFALAALSGLLLFLPVRTTYVLVVVFCGLVAVLFLLLHSRTQEPEEGNTIAAPLGTGGDLPQEKFP